jgi:hypothetical protein
VSFVAPVKNALWMSDCSLNECSYRLNVKNADLLSADQELYVALYKKRNFFMPDKKIASNKLNAASLQEGAVDNFFPFKLNKIVDDEARYYLALYQKRTRFSFFGKFKRLAKSQTFTIMKGRLPI